MPLCMPFKWYDVTEHSLPLTRSLCAYFRKQLNFSPTKLFSQLAKTYQIWYMPAFWSSPCVCVFVHPMSFPYTTTSPRIDYKLVTDLCGTSSSLSFSFFFLPRIPKVFYPMQGISYVCVAFFFLVFVLSPSKPFCLYSIHCWASAQIQQSSISKKKESG